MADATTASAPVTPNSAAARGTNRQPRRGRGGRQGQVPGRTAPSSHLLALRPASIAPQTQTMPTAPSETNQTTPQSSNTARRRARVRRGGLNQNSSRSSGENALAAQSAPGQQGRRGGRGGASTQISGRRQFGGQLTSDIHATSVDVQDGGLSADATEFVPGQQHQPARRRNARPKQPPQTHAPGPRHRAGSIVKSSAEDIMTRTHEDIAFGSYECLICSEPVLGKSKVWSCHTCWAVLHMSCIKRWSSKEAATVSTGRLPDGELPPPRQWRCPGCNLPQDDVPSTYTCWCAKETDPNSIPGLPPHSCGQSCGKERTRPRKCPHTCELVCHAGPCPPCTAMGPERSCFCGKHSSRKRCVETNYDEGWSCDAVCGEPMPCGDPEHFCNRPCHDGLCGACEIPLDAKCYCGKVEKQIHCNDRGDEMFSKMDNKEWTGIFDCGNICERQLDCGKHLCQENCHQQDDTGHHCPMAVDAVTHCTCGKTTLAELGVSRSTCQDPIPACNKICGGLLACGHTCERQCHSGGCPPCFRQVEVDCVCGRTTTQSICLQGSDSKPQCMRLCRATLNCGRHNCEEHCCSGEKRAAERVANKRKRRALEAPPRHDEYEPEHICLRACERSLSCGNPDHTCQELCHRGKCNSCPNAIFEEVACHCGRTVLYPPLPCGTQAPPCRFQCQRPNPCGLHPEVPHSCHGDAIQCPKCPFLVAKLCMCGKKTLKNQPCFKKNVNCGLVCGKTLRCGFHTCQKTCHSSGECEDASGKCIQPCGKPKTKCGHPDLEPCHAPYACKEEKPCQSKMHITCECTRVRVESRCLATRSSDGNTTKKLACDDECARQARNLQLASALNVNPDERNNDHVPYENATMRLYQELPKFAAEYEHKLRIFAADPSERRLRFAPMKKGQREFLHALSQDFGLESESLDPEPHRHVAIFKTPKFVAAPMKTLADCIRIRALQGKLRAVPQTDSTATSDNEGAPAVDERILFNGFVLSNPKFALTVDELRESLAPALKTSASLAFEIAFLPSEEIVLRAKPSSATTTLAPEVVQAALKTIKISIATIVAEKKLAGNVRLCALDNSLNLLRREVDANSNTGGWSMVAAKSQAKPRTVAQQRSTANRNNFLVLGKKKQAEKPVPQLQKEESVAEDWEEAVRKEEEEAEVEAGQQALMERHDSEVGATSEEMAFESS